MPPAAPACPAESWPPDVFSAVAASSRRARSHRSTSPSGDEAELLEPARHHDRVVVVEERRVDVLRPHPRRGHSRRATSAKPVAEAGALLLVGVVQRRDRAHADVRRAAPPAPR